MPGGGEVGPGSSPGLPEEVPFFFGKGLFGVVHRPNGPGRPGWVLCAPFGKERTNSQRLYFEWARAMAEEGYWTLRFDYRGTGDSAGEFIDYSAHDYIDDIAQAFTELQRISGMQGAGVMGLRLGADLAAVFAANSQRGLELVMWEPLVVGRKYQGSLLRTAMANELVHSNGNHRSRDEFKAELENGGFVSVDGFLLSKSMYESLGMIDLTAMERPTLLPILILQMNSGRSRPVTPVVTDLAAKYSRTGETALESAQAPPVWLKTRSYQWRLREVFDTTLKWMASSSPQPRRPVSDAVVEPGENRRTNSVEKPVGFQVRGEKVWGILHEANHRSEESPGIVMVAAGEACRSAFFYTELARNLADAGLTVLRFDPRGIGDSHGDLNCELLLDVFFRVEDGALVPDTLAALDFMEEQHNTSECVVVGLCGGAITSIFVAQSDDRVVGIAPLELPMRLTPGRGASPKAAPSTRIPWDEALSQRQYTLFLLSARRLVHQVRGTIRRIVRRLKPSSSPICSPGVPEWYQQRIGGDASLGVMAALEATLARDIPVCSIFADTEQARHFEAVMPGFLSIYPKSESILEYRIISGADHNFMMPGCSMELTAVLLDWLKGRKFGTRNSRSVTDSVPPQSG